MSLFSFENQKVSLHLELSFISRQKRFNVMRSTLYIMKFSAQPPWDTYESPSLLLLKLDVIIKTTHFQSLQALKALKRLLQTKKINPGKSWKIKLSNLSRIWDLQKWIYTKTNLHENQTCWDACPTNKSEQSPTSLHW